ncbi:tetratricopeptide repeat protein [Sporosarcina beigongshangi]|uniref:tetratricopeptide repeat protein n=1 Tax=Sporosarcina beigongshangi TaxID=2782538 RepID=UPI001939973C|nr:tetratricopeptide repeat protein [Sporosarcina beigongshangi]
MHIGTRLKELRTIRGLTQATLSHGITSAPHYSNIEGGHFATSQDILLLLAKRLSVPSAYLTNGHVQDKKIAILLKQYEHILNEDRLEEALSFREAHEKSFTYIYSLHQELHFKLLRCLDLFKIRELVAFKHFYIEKIAPYIDQDTLHNLSTHIQESFNYISGLYYYVKAEHEACIPFFINVLKSNENPLIQARLNFNIALANFRLNQYTTALEFAEKSQRLYLNLHDWNKTSECYNLIAVLYKSLNNLERAEFYIQKGLHIINNETEEIYFKLLHNLVLIYRVKEQYDEALELIKKCILLKQNYNPDNLFISYRSKLTILLKMGDIDGVINDIELARASCKSTLDKMHLQAIEGQLCLLQNRDSDYAKLIEECIDYYFENKKWKSLKDISEELAKYFAQKKQYKKAYELTKLSLLAIKNS